MHEHMHLTIHVITKKKLNHQFKKNKPYYSILYFDIIIEKLINRKVNFPPCYIKLDFDMKL